ncbi:MAG: PilZ domain-containing protein [Deltaproteobacteria bacterium]|nr:PilZ domain-containing protein [Deltaproteobacteria bacterium]
MRKDPRFVTRDQVLLEVAGRNDLRLTWMSDISKGGLFVRSNDDVPLRAAVTVYIRTPDGDLSLDAEVVHAIPGVGVGLQLINLTPERREAIHAYVEGLAERLDGGADQQAGPAHRPEDVVRAMQVFLRGFEAEDLYGAVGAEPTASDVDLTKRLKSLGKLFESSPDALPPAMVARAHHARSLLRRVSALLKDPSRRLDYDLQHGHVYAERRIALAGGARAVENIRERWHRTFPERVRQAEKNAADAIRAINRLDLEGALTAGEAALEDDPFNLELREVIREWQHRADQRQVPLRKGSRRSA